LDQKRERQREEKEEGQEEEKENQRAERGERGAREQLQVGNDQSKGIIIISFSSDSCGDAESMRR